MIALENVRKVFNQGRPNEYTALDGVSLTVREGEVTAFKGPSGSGKTTLLSIIGCMARPTSGRVAPAANARSRACPSASSPRSGGAPSGSSSSTST